MILNACRLPTYVVHIQLVALASEIEQQTTTGRRLTLQLIWRWDETMINIADTNAYENVRIV